MSEPNVKRRKLEELEDDGEHSESSTVKFSRGKRIKTQLTGHSTVLIYEVVVCLPPLHQWRCFRHWESEDGLVMHALAFLDVSDVVRSKRVNKRWQQLCARAIDVNFQPKQEFVADGDELRRIAKKYCQYEVDSMNEIGRTYGFPINKWPVGKVEDFNRVFANQEFFNEDLNKWDMSNATTLSMMFQGARSFNKPLDSWNTNKADSMDGLFRDATAFNQPLASWKTGQVDDVNYMFCNALSFNKPLESWNTSKVVSMDYMFRGATSFNQSLASWDTSSVESMEGMFKNAVSFNQSLASWNTSSVECMDEMLHNATSFNKPLDSWNTSRVRSTFRMFYNAKSFNQSLDSWDFTDIPPLYTRGMLAGCESFTQNLPPILDPAEVFSHEEENFDY